MNRGEFAAQVNDAWAVSNGLALADQRVWLPNYPAVTAREFRGLSYVDTWFTCLQNNYFDFSFRDGAFVQFVLGSIRPLRLSYSYYECPYEGLTYEGFVEFELELDLNETGDSFREEYETYRMTQEAKEAVTPFRYDYAPKDYVEGRHPASHVHFGHGSSIRIGTDKILKPMSFLMFLLRQCYASEWTSLHKMKDAEVWCRNVEDSLDEVSDKYRNDLDEREMTLH